MSDELEKVTKKANDAYALLSNLSMGHEILKDKVEDLSIDIAKTVFQTHFQESNSKINDSIIEVKKGLQILNDHKDQIFAKIRLLEAEIKELKNVHREMLCEQYDANLRLQEVKNNVSKTRNDLDTNINEKVAAVKKCFLEKIEQLVIPTDTVNIDQVKAQITTQIEPTSLDSRNSLLTARNHDIRLTIVEKKVEGLLLQLRNNELNK